MNSTSAMLRASPRPRVLAVLPALIPSTIIAVVKPLLGLHQRGLVDLEIELESSVVPSRIGRADVVVFCRNCDPHYCSILHTVRAAAKPYIYVLDDDLFSVPVTSEVAAYHHDPLVLRQLEEYVVGAQLVTVFSNTLALKVRLLNPRVETVAASVDLRLLSRPRVRSPNEPLRIVYATSRRKDGLSRLFADDLLGLLDSQYPRVEAHIWGCTIPELENHPQARFLGYIPDYDRFLRKFSRYGYDIGLAPLLDDDFHRSKTNNKFREYGACRIAGIYSNVDVYTSCVQHEVNGLIVSNTPSAWYDAILRLIEDQSLRQEITRRAFQDVKEKYSLDVAQDTWRRQIESVLAESASSRSSGGVVSHLAPRPGVGSEAAAAPRGPSSLVAVVTGGLWTRLTTLGPITPARVWDGLNRRWSQQWALCRIRLATSPLAWLWRRRTS